MLLRLRHLGARTRERAARAAAHFGLRTVILVIAAVLGIVIGVLLSLATLLGRVDSVSSANHDKTIQLQQQATQIKNLINRNHANRLADQKATDYKIRELICAVIAAFPESKGKLLQLIPATYADTNCDLVLPMPRSPSPSPTPSPSPSPSPAVPTTSVRAQPPLVRSTSPRHSSGSATAPSSPVRTKSSPRPSPSSGRSSSAPVLDIGGTLNGVLCDVDRVLGIRCTP